MNNYTIIYMLIADGPAYPITRARTFDCDLDLLGALNLAGSKVSDANPNVEIVLISIRRNNHPKLFDKEVGNAKAESV